MAGLLLSLGLLPLGDLMERTSSWYAIAPVADVKSVCELAGSVWPEVVSCVQPKYQVPIGKAKLIKES